MSNVVAFRRNTSRKAIVRKPNETGHILLFTGVRYMREDAAEGASQPSVVTATAAQETERLQA